MPLFHARDLTISLEAATGYDGTTLPSAEFTAATEIFVKEFSLNEGEQEFDQQNYTGERASGYQNQAKVHKPKGPAELTVKVDIDALATLQGLLYDSSAAIGGTHTLYRSGNAAKKNVDVWANLDDGTDAVQFVLVEAEQVGPMTELVGTDGQFEYEIKLKCLAADFYGPLWKD